jgi:hypothetical protein
VLKGLIKSIKKWDSLPVILCEVGWGISHPFWAEEVAIFKKYESIGYSICDIDSMPINIESLTETTDVLLLPNPR